VLASGFFLGTMAKDDAEASSSGGYRTFVKNRKSAVSKYNVEKFDGQKNFSLWMRRMMNLLVQDGLEDTLSSEKPDKVSPEEWQYMQGQACSMIELHLADNVLIQVMDDATSAYKVWALLKELYMTKSVSNQIFLLQSLFKLRMSEGGNIQEHLSKFSQCIHELTQIGETVSEAHQAMHLLMSLPASYEGLVTTMSYGKETLKLADVKATLLSDQLRKKSNHKESKDTALVVRGRPKERNHGGSSKGRSKSKTDGKGKRKGVCWKCGSKDHWKNDCPTASSSHTSPSSYTSPSPSSNIVTVDDDCVLVVESQAL
jgi:gag-polypeptide of LTR copia-type/Zinc knuckle